MAVLTASGRDRRARREGLLQRRVESVLARAGVRAGGARPWDIRIHDGRCFRRVAFRGAWGLGESYVAGWWDCDALDQFFDRCFRADAPAAARWTWPTLLDWAAQRLFNGQTLPLAGRNARAHYDLGNDLFRAMLDERMVYSCAYWRHATDLAAAQEAKLDLVCRKLALRPGMRVLDLGCGWGSFAAFAAERHGAQVVGVTLSEPQAALGRERCAGLPVELRVQDYRLVRDCFHRVVSIGMFEHVGPKNHAEFFATVRRCLVDDGLALIHFFGTQRPAPDRRDSEVLWIRRRIFPGLACPSVGQVGRALRGRFVVEDIHNFGADYDPTLMAWHANFQKAWPRLRGTYGDRFERLWRYYLLSAAGAFRSRKYQVWQWVLSPRGVEGGYDAVR